MVASRVVTSSHLDGFMCLNICGKPANIISPSIVRTFTVYRSFLLVSL